MQKFEWNIETDDGRRYYRAHYHAKRWQISTTLKTDPDWEDNIDAPVEVWQMLRDHLWTKYQRRRCTWKIVRTVDVLLEKEFGIEPPVRP